MLTVVVATIVAAEAGPVVMVPSGSIASAGSRNTPGAGPASGGRSGAQPGAVVVPSGAGTSRRGAREERAAAISHWSMDRPSRRPNATTVAAPAIGIIPTTKATGETRGPKP